MVMSHAVSIIYSEGNTKHANNEDMILPLRYSHRGKPIGTVTEISKKDCQILEIYYKKQTEISV